MKITWQQRMTNKRVVELAGINEISCEVRRRRWNWLGHALRREGENDCFTVLGWTPEGRRAQGDLMNYRAGDWAQSPDSVTVDYYRNQ